MPAITLLPTVETETPEWSYDVEYIVENINNPESISVYDTNDQLLAHYDVPQQINGYEYEFMEAVACISAGKLESDSMPMDDTVFMMEVMDSLRNSWGLVYPQEQ